MTSRPYFAALTVLLMNLAAGAEVRSGYDLKLMTFNVRYGTADDGPDAWEHRRDLLVETIRNADPGILGTQECLEFQAEYIQQQLPEYRWIGMGRDTGALGEMTALFYKKSVLAPVEMGHFWLSEKPEEPGSVSWDSSLTRMVTWARFYHRREHTFFTVFNTHFDHKGVVAREESAKALAKRTKDFSTDDPVIVLGDFNSVAETSKPWDTLREAGFKDAWLEAKEKAGPETTWSGFGKEPQQTGPHRIDWILTRGPIQVERAEIITINKAGRYPSDHFPVTAMLALKAEP
ncbi:MAG: endonuclease/exonuclease/phosphatase family protein [Candidatus Hydrogenedentes bacterium]|nr:endonuclease/exonuclease/phosphatase family protein [Candidatus Hydrogenedentota bacterium]